MFKCNLQIGRFQPKQCTHIHSGQNKALEGDFANNAFRVNEDGNEQLRRKIFIAGAEYSALSWCRLGLCDACSSSCIVMSRCYLDSRYIYIAGVSKAVTCKYKQINTFMVTSHGCDCIYQSRKYFEMKLIWSNNSPGRHPSAHPTSCSEQGHGLLPLEVAMCVTPHLMFHFIISQRLLWYFCGT